MEGTRSENRGEGEMGRFRRRERTEKDMRAKKEKGFKVKNGRIWNRK